MTRMYYDIHSFRGVSTTATYVPKQQPRQTVIHFSCCSNIHQRCPPHRHPQYGWPHWLPPPPVWRDPHCWWKHHSKKTRKLELFYRYINSNRMTAPHRHYSHRSFKQRVCPFHQAMSTKRRTTWHTGWLVTEWHWPLLQHLPLHGMLCCKVAGHYGVGHSMQSIESIGLRYWGKARTGLSIQDDYVRRVKRSPLRKYHDILRPRIPSKPKLMLYSGYLTMVDIPI